MYKDPKNLNAAEELSLGESVGWARKITHIFPAFGHHNYRLFFIGQLVSLVGTWLQNVALGWVVLELTHSSFWVSFIAAMNFLPVLLFSLPAGVLIDQVQKRKVVFAMEATAMILAFIFAAITHFNLLHIGIILLLTFFMGVVSAIDMPARQSFMVDVVGKEDLSSAIAMNAGMYNAARIIGPAIAGILIATVGSQGAFFLNGVSFIAVLWSLMAMIIPKTPIVKKDTHPIEQLKEGLSFSRSHPLIRDILLLVAFNAIFPWSYASIMPTIAEKVYHTNSAGYGLLLSAAGLGAFLGALYISGFAKKVHAIRTIGIANAVVSVALVGFSFCTNFYLGLFLLVILGFGLIVQGSLSNSTIQKTVPDAIRGRVMSIYSVSFAGMIPLGSIMIGTLATYTSELIALRVFGIISVVGAVVYILSKKPAVVKQLITR
jgi:MFS family permease